jgi:lipopolysaccharide/colanic/teichoic acid biosynthesis glycosyltransferase
MVVPGMIYPFLISFSVFIFYLGIYRKSIFSKSIVVEFLKTFNPLIILGLFYSIGILITLKIYPHNLKDLFEFAVNLILLFGLFYIIHQKQSKKQLLNIFHQLTTLIQITAVFIAAVGILKYYLQGKGYEILLDTPWGSAFNQDKNFYALYSFLGIISFYPSLIQKVNMRIRFVHQIWILILIVNIIFSFSLRSVFILGIIIVALLYLQINGFFTRSAILKNISGNLRFVTITLFLLILFLLFSVSRNPGYYHQVSQNYIESSAINHNESILTERLFNLDKWSLTLEIFNEQHFWKKLFGDGFYYLEIFGKQFDNEESVYGYPHNPVLSALLYSGVVGALFVFVFLMISSYYALIYFKQYPLFSMMLLVSLMFVFFSGNSIFSVPVFLFLFSLSFIIRHQEINELHIQENINKPGSKVLKEVFDYLMATGLFIVLFPVLLMIALSILLTMGWPVFFSQKRIGQNGKIFLLHKFRTMKNAKSDTSVAAKEGYRITILGAFLRRSKLDELPELINIIRGDMSFVGPRPDVKGYADRLVGDDRRILQLKPGLTGAASLKYKDEEELLKKQRDPQQYNDEVIFPDKVRINKLYMEKWTLWLDMKIILFTALGKELNEKYFK